MGFTCKIHRKSVHRGSAFYDDYHSDRLSLIEGSKTASRQKRLCMAFFLYDAGVWRFDSWLSSDSEITPDGYDLGDGFADHGICVQYRADAELFQRNTGRARGSCTDGWSRAVS